MARRAGFLLIAVAIIASMAYVADQAWRSSDAHRRAQVEIERIRSTSQAIGALNTENLAAGHTPKRLTVDAGLVQRGWALDAQLKESVETVRASHDGPMVDRLARDAGDLQAAGLQVLAVARTGNMQAAAMARGTLLRPVLERFERDTTAAARREEASATRASHRGRTMLFGSMGVGLVLLLLLARWLQRAARSAARADERRSLERRSEDRIRALVEHSSDVVSVVGDDLRVHWQAASIRQMLGREPEALLGAPLADLAHPEDRTYVEGALAAAARRPGGLAVAARLGHADGSWRHVEIHGENRLEDPAVDGIVLSMRDVTDRKALEDELRHQAFHDSLTGLANRALFEDRLRHALARARRHAATAAVLFLDLDDFKTVNDSLGHARGDELLRAVAERVDGVIRPADTAARLGGDEFGVLLENLDDPGEADRVGRRLLEALAPPIEIAGRELRVCGSIGYALSDGATPAEDVLRNADTAMYAAKEMGKSRVQAFEPGMHRRVLDRLDLTAQIQDALRLGQFELDYQPIVQLADGSIAGVEALVRWSHPDRGRIAPGEFIPLAEETGLIVPLGLWVLETACAQTAGWHRAYPDRAPLTISVNVSTRQLAEAGFTTSVTDVLERTGLPASALVLEITESLLADDRGVLVERLRELKRLGVSVAVDDFGTGYSALSRLQNFPVDVLKIDRSFVDGIEVDSDKADLVRGIVSLGDTLRLGIVAEGIEEHAQAEQLRAMRSPLGQGFLFSRPVGRDGIDALLADGVRFSAGV